MRTEAHQLVAGPADSHVLGLRRFPDGRRPRSSCTSWQASAKTGGGRDSWAGCFSGAFSSSSSSAFPSAWRWGSGGAHHLRHRAGFRCRWSPRPSSRAAVPTLWWRSPFSSWQATSWLGEDIGAYPRHRRGHHRSRSAAVWLSWPRCASMFIAAISGLRRGDDGGRRAPRCCPR